MKWIFFCLACYLLIHSSFSNANTLFYSGEVSQNHFGLSHVKELTHAELGVNIYEFSKLQAFQLQLPGSVDVTVKKIRSEYRKKNSFYFYGHVENDPYGSVNLILKNQILSGEIVTGGHTYWIFYKSKKYYLVENEHLGSKGMNGNDYIKVELKNKSSKNPVIKAATTSTDRFIDLMIVYTDDVATADSNAEATLTAQVASMNTMLEQSCINFRYRLVHIQEVTYTETDDAETDLTALRAGVAAPFNTVKTLRDTHGADLVQLVTTNDPGLCGLAYTPSPTTDESLGFSVTIYGCGAKVIAHELGHNMGIAHDRNQEDIGLQDTNSTYKYRYGFVDLVNKKRSIMSYSKQCTNNSISCTWVGRFSNPSIMHKGVRFGLDSYADAARGHNENMSLIAAYRTAVTSYSPEIKNFCLSKNNKAEDEKDIHCFIATAAHGSYMHPQVLKLRAFRDKILKNSELGKKIIALYYKISPPIALQVSTSPLLKTIMKGMIFSMTFLIDYGLMIICSLLFIVITFLLYMRNKNYFGITSFILLTLLASSVVENSYAAVSYPSYFKHDLGENPATRLLISSRMHYAAGLEINNKKIESEGGHYKEKNKEKSLALVGGIYSPNFFFDAKINAGGGSETDIHSAGFSDSTSESDITNINANIGTSLIFIPLGLKVKKYSSEHKKTKKQLESTTLGLGSYLNLFGFQLGAGVNYITEKGNETAQAKWIETYIGFGTGLVLSSAKFHGEIYVIRSPQVFNFEGTKYNFHPEKLTIGINAEFSGLPFMVIKKFGANLEKINESAVDYYLDEDVSRTLIELSVEGPLLAPGSAWSASVSQSSGSFEHDDSSLGINLFISYSI